MSELRLNEKNKQHLKNKNFEKSRYKFYIQSLVNIYKDFRYILSLKKPFFCWTLVLVGWQTSCSSLVMKLDFISQPSSKSILPWAGQHMQKCQVGWNIPLSLFAPGFWSKWMVPVKWSPQWGFKLTTSQLWVYCLNHYAPNLKKTTVFQQM